MNQKPALKLLLLGSKNIVVEVVSNSTITSKNICFPWTFDKDFQRINN